MEEVKKAYERIDILMGKLDKILSAKPVSKSGVVGTGDILQFKDEFIECMDDDFNTPRALAILFDLVNKCNVLLDGDDRDKNLKLNLAVDMIKEMADVFGLSFFKKPSGMLSDNQIEWYITVRAEYKKQKKFQEADAVRKKLKGEGIILEDTKDGTTWRRKI
jgi:cysteinyl-tRNA synthetase